jgi:hypothetical protein
LDDNLVARLEALAYQPLIANGTVRLDHSEISLIVGIQHHGRRIATRIVRNSLLGDQQCRFVDALIDLLMDEHAWKQRTVRVRKLGTQRHRTGSGIDRHLGKFELAGMSIGTVIFQGEFHEGLIVADLLELPGGELALQPQQQRNGLHDVYVNRIQLLDYDEIRGLRGGHQRTLGH